MGIEQQKARLTTTQIGFIGENVVASQLLLTSEGRFSPFLPVADDDGVDLIVYDKVTGISLPIQVKSRTVGSKSPGGVVQFNLRLKTFSDRYGCHVLAILLDTHRGQIERAWLIPMADFPSIATEKKGDFVIRPSPKLTSKDRYAPYRCQDMREVTDRLLAFLDTAPSSG